MTSRLRFVVVGGGISGLVAAYRLKVLTGHLSLPPEVHLFETSQRLGGTIKTLCQDGFLLEGGPDCFLSEKSRGVALAEELDLEKELLETQAVDRRSFIVRHGRLHPVPEGFYLIGPSRAIPFLMSPILSWKGKLRMLKELFIPPHPPPLPPGERENWDESLASFVRRRLGQEALERLAQPMIGGIYAADPEKLSLRATFPDFLEMEKTGGVLRTLLKKHRPEAERASGPRYSLFVTFKKGMQTLTDRLAQELPSEGIHLGVAVDKIQKKEAGWETIQQDGQTILADGVCLALPSYQSARLLRDQDSVLSNQLASIPYTDSATLHFAFRREAVKHPLNGFGFVVPSIEKRSLLACTFSHKKFAERAPEGAVLLRVFLGGPGFGDVSKQADDELKKRAWKDLSELLGITTQPLFTCLERHYRSIAQYAVGHLEKVQQIEERMRPLRGLALAGNGFRGVGIPDCIESGDRAAARLVDYISQK